MKFGLKFVRRLTGAEIYVRATELISILPVIYVFMVSGYPGIVAKQGFFSVLFDWGVSALPRGFVWFCSFIYRLTTKEMLLCFAFLVPMLAFGLLMGRLLRGSRKTAIVTRLVLAVLILADLVVRLLPIPMNSFFGLAPSVFGFALRLAFLVFIVLDLVFDKKSPEKSE